MKLSTAYYDYGEHEINQDVIFHQVHVQEEASSTTSIVPYLIFSVIPVTLLRFE